MNHTHKQVHQTHMDKTWFKKSCDTQIYKTFFSFDCVQITNKVDFNNSNKQVYKLS